MEIWEQFLGFEYAYEILMGVGGMLVIVGFLKILRTSLAAIFWVLLVGVGAFTVSFGLDRSTMGFSAQLSQEVKDLVDGPGKELSMSALRKLCSRFE